MKDRLPREATGRQQETAFISQRQPLPPLFAVLDEALSIIRLGVPPEAWPNPAVVKSACASVAAFLETMPYASVRAAAHPPPKPNLDSLRRAGVPLACDADLDSALANQRQRRQMLLGLVRNDGWTWEAVSKN